MEMLPLYRARPRLDVQKRSGEVRRPFKRRDSRAADCPAGKKESLPTRKLQKKKSQPQSKRRDLAWNVSTAVASPPHRGGTHIEQVAICVPSANSQRLKETTRRRL